MGENARIDVAILGAVPQEVEGLLRFTGCVQPLRHLGVDFRAGLYEGRSLLIGTTGLGKVNAAVTAASLLDRFDIGEVWNVGSAGAYEEGPLAVGDVLFSTEAIAGDEGILAVNGVLPLADIGIPLVKRGDEAFFDSFPLGDRTVVAKPEKSPPGLYRPGGEPSPGARLLCEEGRTHCPDGCDPGLSEASPAPGRASPRAELPADEGVEGSPFHLFHGPSLTVSMVSGDPETAHARYARHGAYAENMEGSAVVHACFRFGVPVAEIRGISNIAGNRNRRDWRLRAAVAHCHGILLKLLGPAEPYEPCPPDA